MKRILIFLLVFVMLISVSPVFAEDAEIAEETGEEANEAVVEVVKKTTVTDENGEVIEEEAELLASQTVNLWVGDVTWLSIYDYTMGKDVQTSSISWYTNAYDEVRIMSKSWDMRECQIRAVSATGNTPAIVSCQFREATFGLNYHYQTVDFYVYVKQYVSVSGFSIVNDTFTLKNGNWNLFDVNISPYNASNKNIQWTSSNPSVATCVTNYIGSTPYGVVTAVGVGETILTGSLGGYTDTIKVIVYDIGRKGDISGDGVIDDADWMKLANHLAGYPLVPALDETDPNCEMFSVCDVNSDGLVDDADWMSLANHLSGFPLLGGITTE